MKRTSAAIFFAVLLFTGLILLTSCGETETKFGEYESPYETYDKLGYTVSVNFDANGGSFTGGVSNILDTFNPSKIETQADGKKHITLIAPDDLRRGKMNAYTPSNSDTSNQYFFMGWYTERTPITNELGEPLDYDGNLVSESGNKPAYEYSGKWDFTKDTIVLEDGKTYTSSEPTLTLYAAWVPQLRAELCDRTSGAVISTYLFNPNSSGMEIDLPGWNSNGEIDFNDFSGSKELASYSSKTFDRAYLDIDGTLPITGSTVTHSALISNELGCIVRESTDESGNTVLVPSTDVADRTMRIYADFRDGIWFYIFNADTLKKAVNKSKGATVDINLIIGADIDFTKDKWISVLTTKKFTGTILGNGHTFSNISATQSSLADSFGLFASIDDEAVIKDLNIENATVTIKSGYGKGTAKYGLLAGEIGKNAEISGVTVSGSLLLSADAIKITNHSIGLISGNIDGYNAGIAFSSVICAEYKRDDNDADKLVIDTHSESQTVDVMVVTAD